MKIALINPNSTAGMTEKAAEVARRFAFSGTDILAANPPDTPASIEGHYDEAVSVPGLLREIRKAEAAGADGYVVACFDDPGLGRVAKLLPVRWSDFAKRRCILRQRLRRLFR